MFVSRRILCRVSYFAVVCCGLVGASVIAPARAADEPPKLDTRRGDKMFADYFAAETAELSGAVLNRMQTAAEWNSRKDELRRQLREMLGLDPLPERTPLEPVVTGIVDHPEFTVEKVHFQSRPKLYVTGNLYVPKGLQKPAPAVLYVCGHGNVKKDGISYGSKANYQHHGAWLARQGYVCLIVDTLQLGEIEGLHHGTYHKGMFWWMSRGYTPAGVEVWNGMRALDYLQSRKEVDPEKLGVTGRSGGGAQSWFIAAADERVKAAVPIAGITDLQNYVTDGKVEGHCDCMFMANTYRWDYGTVAALVAPRPLLFSNTDDDRIFPLDGVERIHWQVRKVYGLLGAAKDLGLQISWGGHYDTQELQVAALRWFNLHLKKEDPKIEIAALKLFQPEELKVFAELPADEKNTTAHEWFVPTAPAPTVPASAAEWTTLRDGWMRALREKAFRGWPTTDEPLAVDERRMHRPTEGRADTMIRIDFVSEGVVRLTANVMSIASREPCPRVTLHVTNSAWTAVPATLDVPLVTMSPRGELETAFNPTPRTQTQVRRRFYLLGQTLEGQQVYDVRRAIQALHTVPEFKDAKITLSAYGPMASIALYAALFEPSVDRLELANLPKSHMPTSDDPDRFASPLLNVLRYLDVPQAVAMAAERATVVLATESPADWRYPVDVAQAMGWKDRVVVRSQP